MTSGNPVLVRRQLGAALRKLREAAGRDRAEVAELLGNSERWAERLERGDSARIKVTELTRMLDEYRVTDDEIRREFLELLRATGVRGWWAAYTSVLPKNFPVLLGFEAAAKAIHTFEAYVIPGLLQTEDYARAIMTTGVPEVSPETIDRRIKVRLERQERLWSADGPEFHAIIDEGALRRKIGGADVWRAQLSQLAETAASGSKRVTVQILPFDAAAPPTVLGSFTLLHLNDGAWVSCTEHKTGDRFDELESADVYRKVFARLVAEAEGPAKTARIITRIAKED